MNKDNIIAERADKIIYRDGDKAIKLFNENYKKADVLNEALNQARVEETGLLIPKILEVTKIDGKWAIISEYIEGTTLEKLMKDNPQKEDEYLEKMIELQLKVFSMKAPLLNKLKDKMIRKIGEADIDATTKYDLHTRIEGMHNHNKVCHGDFNPSNIIITDKGAEYILDWSHATQGNASGDAARTYLLFALAGKKKTAEKYLDKFCADSGISKQYIYNWLPIVAASQLVKNKPEERDMLLQWASVVDYE